MTGTVGKSLLEDQKKELNNKLNAKITQLKNICKDAVFADHLIDDLLSLKGQLSIEPTLVHIPLVNVIKEYDFEHFKIIKTLNGIVFKMTGYEQIIRPTCLTLYGQLDYLLGLKDRYDTLTLEEKDIYDTLFQATATILMNPAICFTDDDYWIDIVTFITKRQNELFEKLLSTPLQPEDAEKDDKFMEEVKDLEDFKESVTKSIEENGGKGE